MTITKWASPKPEKLAQIVATLEAKYGNKNPKIINNHLYWAAYNVEDGWYGKKRPRNTWSYDEDGNLVRTKTRMRRREWMEENVHVRDKRTGELKKFTLNPAQRRLEAWVIRMERAGVPVRLICCKARQIGFSTYSEAFMLWLALHKAQVSALLIADTNKRAKELLRIANTARENIPSFYADEDPIAFDMDSEATYSLAWASPMNSEIEITSSETKGAGRGGTRRCVVQDEKAFWSHAEEVMGSVGPSLPKIPGTYGFTISTANGDYGLFRDEFVEAWKMRNLSIDQRIEKTGDCTIAQFFAWYEQPEYRWTKTVSGRTEIPEEMAKEIVSSLDDEEKFLLEQRYYERGIGWRQVDLDQIAWWRAILRDQSIHGDRNLRRQEYAYSPETCFLSSGSRVFDPEKIQKLKLRVTPPVWVGTLEPARSDQTDGRSYCVVPSHQGTLDIWQKPIEGRKYVIGSDAAGGGSDSDFAAAVVVDSETCVPVATWEVRMQAGPWGDACAFLGWYYNDAILAFETYPSAFGMVAAHRAVDLGYPNVFTRHRTDTAQQEQTDLLGFRTQVDTKPLLIGRLRQHLDAEILTPSAELLDQLSAQAFEAGTEKMVAPAGVHDDLVIAFGIALYVRDLYWTQGLLRPEEEKATTEADKFWSKWRSRRGMGPKNTGRKFV